jgi:nucleoside-diphosphate kinase
MTSDVCIGLELVAKEAVTKWREVIGPTNTVVAKKQAPSSIRAKFGVDGTLNAVHGSDSAASHQREINFWFGGKPEQRPMQTTAVTNNCTLCIIKPHVIKEGLAGQIIDMIISEGFEISAMEMFNLSRPVIEEFYDIYKGVLPEYVPLIEHMSNGPIIALEVRQQNVVTAFRDLCGPHDPEIAKHLRPNTIR